MPSSQPFAITATCARCARASRLDVDDWTQEKPVLAQRWVCPHCQHTNSLAVTGIITRVMPTAESF